jgi:nucleotide-binding universal stress UspA family protein
METFSGYRRILAPIDFSRHCDRTLSRAAWMAQQSSGTIYLVHVVLNPFDEVYESAEVPNWGAVEHAAKKSAELLDKTGRECLGTGVKWEAHVFGGDPYEKLVKAAEDLKVDLIVASRRGRSSIAHLLIGSVAEKLARHAPCAVLFVRPVEED